MTFGFQNTSSNGLQEINAESQGISSRLKYYSYEKNTNIEIAEMNKDAKGVEDQEINFNKTQNSKTFETRLLATRARENALQSVKWR